MVKEYKKRRKKFIEDFNISLPKFTSNLPSFVSANKKENITSFSWFDINRYKTKKVSNNLNINTNFSEQIISCQKIKMILDDTQKIIIDKWFQSYTNMYNATLDYIRNNCGTFKNEVIRRKLKNIDKKLYVNAYNLRDELKEIRNGIINDSQIISINKDTKIQTHTLDYAVRQLVSNIKSAMTNLRKGHIKKFRIKFWKHSRPSKTIEIEKQYIRNNKICSKILGDIKYEYNNSEYKLDNIDSNVKINYNSITNEYLLLIPIKNIPTEIEEKPRNFISLDPGLRTFMTGLTERECLKIGTNVNQTIKTYIRRLNKIKNNKEIPKKIKKKNEEMINRKIYNKVDDLQWKTIDFLIKNFKNILLGDMSAKSIVAKNKSVLNDETKVACLRTRFYDFQKRLEYKCQLTKTNYKLVNECYTSKTCSLCGNYNDKLKGEEIYNCKKCNKKIDRDVNGCRNIMIKCLMV